MKYNINYEPANLNLKAYHVNTPSLMEIPKSSTNL